MCKNGWEMKDTSRKAAYSTKTIFTFVNYSLLLKITIKMLKTDRIIIFK